MLRIQQSPTNTQTKNKQASTTVETCIEIIHVSVVAMPKWEDVENTSRPLVAPRLRHTTDNARAIFFQIWTKNLQNDSNVELFNSYTAYGTQLICVEHNAVVFLDDMRWLSQ